MKQDQEFKQMKKQKKPHHHLETKAQTMLFPSGVS